MLGCLAFSTLAGQLRILSVLTGSNPAWNIMVSTRSKRGAAAPGSPPASPGKSQMSPPAKRAKVPQPKTAGSKNKKTASPASTKRALGEKCHFLFKSEPESRMEKGVDMRFGIDDLAKCKDQTEPWDGVRNHEAKNTMRSMSVGDLGFFYHSNCKKVRPGIVGIVEVVRDAYPDHTAWDTSDPHYDSKSSKENPRWWMVDVRLVRKFNRCVTLDEIKAHEDLSEMQLVKRGRISVQGVKKHEWDTILALAEKDAV